MISVVGNRNLGKGGRKEGITKKPKSPKGRKKGRNDEGNPEFEKCHETAPVRPYLARKEVEKLGLMAVCTANERFVQSTTGSSSSSS